MIDNRKNVIYSYLSQLVGVVTGFLLSIVLVRNLEVQEFGEYSFLGSAIILLGILVSFGLEGVKQRYITEFLAKNKYGKVNKIIYWTMLIRVGSLLVLSLILLLFYEDLKKYFSLTLGFSSFLIFLGIFFISKIRQLLGTSLLNAYLKVYKEKINLIFYQTLKLVSFSYVVINSYGISELLIAWIFVEFLSLIHFIVLAFKKVKFNKEKSFINKFTKEEKNRMFEFGKYQTFAVVLFMFADISVDNIMIGYFLDQEAVGKYAFALGILIMISKANPAALMRGMFSSMMTKRYTVNKSLDDLKTQYILIAKLTIVVVVPLYFLLLINAEQIIRLVYNEKYLDTLPLIYLGVLFFIFRELTHPFNPLINTLEKNKLFLYTGMFSIYNGLANLVLIPWLGIMGALIATGSAAVMIFYFYLYQFRKIFNVKYFPLKSLFRIVLYSLSILGVGLVFNSYVTNIWILLLVILIEIGLFYIIINLFKVFSIDERNILNKQMGKNLVNF